jgi:hypothetical protein
MYDQTFQRAVTYTHVLKVGGGGVRSPVDALPQMR